MTVKLNYATIETVNALIDKGLERRTAETLVQQFSNQEHDNVYSVKEIDKMMADTVREVFERYDSKFEQFRKDERRELEDFRKEYRKEAKSDRRWIVGTMITVGLAIITANFTYLHYFASMVH